MAPKIISVNSLQQNKAFFVAVGLLTLFPMTQDVWLEKRHVINISQWQNQILGEATWAGSEILAKVSDILQINLEIYRISQIQYEPVYCILKSLLCSLHSACVSNLFRHKIWQMFIHAGLVINIYIDWCRKPHGLKSHKPKFIFKINWWSDCLTQTVFVAALLKS